MLFFVILFFLMTFWKCKIYPKDYIISAEFLDYDSTCALRGICAVEIMLGHIGKYLGIYFVLKPFQEAGILVVGVFFLLSGYGLMYGKIHKTNYLSGFIKKHLFKLLIPAYMVYILKLPELAIMNHMNIPTVLRYIAGEQLLALTNWYIWETLLLYIAFYICYKNFDAKRATIILGFIIIIFVSICYLLNMKAVWYASVFNFLLGVLCAMKTQKIIDIFNRNTYLKLLFSLLICGTTILLFVFLPESNVLIAIIKNVICRNIATLFFSISLLLFLYRIRLGNQLTLFLGKISFEIYLVHFIFLSLFHSVLYIENDYLYVVFVVLCSFIAAYIFNRVLKILSAFYTKGKL